MWKHFVSISIIWLSFVRMSGAQVATGTISGTVTDSAGAVILDAKVTIRNVETGIGRTVTTNAAGRYLAAQLSLGSYEAIAEAKGFQTVVRSGVVLTVGREAVVDFTLPVGAVSERITVRGDAPMVQTTTTEMASLVDSKTIVDLPLNGRNYVQLILLQPAVSQQTTLSSQIVVGTGLKFSVAGSRVTSNRFLLDGTDINDQADTTPGSAAGVSLGIDALREFEILTNTYSAKYGRKSGGVVNAVTKAGTNEIHGAALYFHRNDDLDARNFFDPGRPPEFKRNQFGSSLGGPIRKDSAFIFGSYEGLRERLGLTRLAFVPSEEVHRGFVAGQFAGINPRIQSFLNAWPLPNGRDFRDGRAEFNAGPKQPTRDDFFVTRFDQRFSEKDSFFVSYVFDDSRQEAPDGLPIFSTLQGGRTQYVSLEETRIISASLLNVFHFGFNRSAQVWGKGGGVDVPSFLPGQGPGSITVPGLTGFGNQQFLPRLYFFNVFQYKDNVVYSAGSHNLQFGAEAYRYRDSGAHTNRPRGIMSFNSIRDLLLAQPALFSANIPGSDAYRNFRYTYLGLYVQDDFHWKPGLTFNLGLRWEMTTRPSEIDGKTSNLLDIVRDRDFTVGNIFLRNPTLRNFGPRVGLAWDPFGNGKTSVRSAFGIFYDQPISSFFNILAAQTEPFLRTGEIRLPPFPNVLEGAAFVAGTRRAFALSKNVKDPTKMQWNLNIQRELFPSTSLMVGYIGTAGRHLPWIAPGNNGIPTILPDGRRFFPTATFRNPAFGDIQYTDTTANSFYHGFVLSVVRRFAQGLQVQGSYTLSKSIDDQGEQAGILDLATGGRTFPDDPKADRGLSAFDARHIGNINLAYDLPFGRGRAGALEKLFAGWKVAGILNVSTGTPFTVQVTGANFSRRNPVNLMDRPDLVPDRSNNPVLGNPNRWYDPTAFRIPQPGFVGNVGRSTVTGPNFKNFDLTLTKNTQLMEALNLQFRAEFFNLFNHPNFGLPQLAVRGPATAAEPDGAILGNAGRISNTRNTSRQIQFGLKFMF